MRVKRFIIRNEGEVVKVGILNSEQEEAVLLYFRQMCEEDIISVYDIFEENGYDEIDVEKILEDSEYLDNVTI